MKNYYWNLESWGDAYPPENAEEIVSSANEMIDAFIDANPDADDDMICAYSEKLWNGYCVYEDTVQEIIEEKLFDVAVNLMDDDIREAIHDRLAPCSEYVFLLFYMIQHEEKFHEAFTV